MIARCLPFVASLLTQVGVGQATVGFPTAPYEAWLDGGGQEPSISAQCHGSAQLEGICVTKKVRDGYGWSFLGFSDHGTLAVFRSHVDRVCGVATGFDGVTCIDFAVGSSLPPGTVLLVITGYQHGGASAVRGFIYDAQAPMGPQSGTLFDLPVGAQPGPGEIFVAASILGTDLFVYEGASGCLFRMIDTNGDQLPDSRNPGFCVSVPDPGVRGRGPIDRFRYHPGFVIQTSTRYPRRTRSSGVVDTGGGQLQYQHAIAVGEVLPATSYPRFAGAFPVAGQNRLLVSGLLGQSLVAEDAPDPNGPWTIASLSPEAPSTPKSPVILFLSAPLGAGKWIRVRDVQSATTSSPRLVGAAEPILYTKHKGVLSGGSFQLLGDNLSVQTTARFRPMGGSAEVTLRVAPLTSSTSVTLTAPSVGVHTQGFCVLESPGQKSVAFFLMVSP